MSNPIRKRTESDVVEYIKNHSKDGKLTESLMDIAEGLGYSNATIHRVLKSLEEHGVVEIIPSDKPTKPNTIVYNGPIKEATDVVSQGKMLLAKLTALTEEVTEYIAESSRVIGKLQAESSPGVQSLSKDIVDKIELPDTEHYLLMVRREAVDRMFSSEAAEEFVPVTEMDTAYIN